MPWLALRAVLDPFELDLPELARESHTSYLGAALRHALHGPRAIFELADLCLRSVRAAHALTTALSALGLMLASTRARYVIGADPGGAA